MADQRFPISDEDDVTLPLVDILTGRGFVTGKSGSGKSNTVNVIVEELLDRDQPLLIIDTDGEYWGLKEEYEILHLGNGEQCDVRVTSTDAETIVDLALVDNVPIILDISGFLHKEDAQEVTHRVVRELFHREKTLKEPFLLIVEEVHEYIPETGGLSDMGKMLIQVAKRGRKHGLGFCGVSQRPASVDKDFITQCDWIVWHRLTWKNDTDVVGTILGTDAADTVEDLDPGEALLMSDWDEQLSQVQIREKRTYDAGATPGFEATTPPDLIPVDSGILAQFDERRRNVAIDGDAEEADGDEPRPVDAMEEATAPEDAEEPEPPEDDTEEPEADTDAPPAETVPVDDAADPAESTEDDDSHEGRAEDEAVEEPAEASGELAPSDGGVVQEPAAADGAEVREAEVVRTEAGQPARGERRPRGRNGVARSAPAGETDEPIVVEFAELLLYLSARTRDAMVSGAVRVADGLRNGLEWVRTHTQLEDEDAIVVGWLVLVVLFIVGLALGLTMLL